MNKDIRYGMGDITFDMNIGWFDQLIYEIDGWSEKDGVDHKDVMELYEHAEQLITREMNKDNGNFNIHNASEAEIFWNIWLNDPHFYKLLNEYYTQLN